MIAVVVVNYRRAAETLECLRALATGATGQRPVVHVVLVDNGVSPGHADPALARYIADSEALTYIPLPENEGFAGACNRAIDWVLSHEGFEAVALLNNDASACPGWLAAMAAHLDPSGRVDMVAARMMVAGQPGCVDSLGITLYRSGFAANRKSTAETLLGPCGGAALYSVRLLRALRDVSGHVFDEDFFCYAEDTDLAVRARLLGFKAAFADDAVVEHRGSLTAGGADSDFVMYHGLRNSLCVMRRDLPAGFVARFWPWMLVARAGVLAKYVRQGRSKLLWAVYRDYLRRRARNIDCRKKLRESGALRWKGLAGSVSPGIYDRAYIRKQLRALARPPLREGDRVR